MIRSAAVIIIVRQRPSLMVILRRLGLKAPGDGTFAPLRLKQRRWGWRAARCGALSYGRLLLRGRASRPAPAPMSEAWLRGRRRTGEPSASPGVRVRPPRLRSVLAERRLWRPLGRQVRALRPRSVPAVRRLRVLRGRQVRAPRLLWPLGPGHLGHLLAALRPGLSARPPGLSSVPLSGSSLRGTTGLSRRYALRWATPPTRPRTTPRRAPPRRR